MKVLMITSEASPFAQTGGLGEVLAALPAELAELGMEVEVLLPKYKNITPANFNISKTETAIELTLNAKKVTAYIWEYIHPSGAKYLFLECDDYYDRQSLYGTMDGDYEDNAERFVFLTRAAIELALSRGVTYDVFHCHDWEAALTPVYLRTLYAGETLLQKSAAVMTIHNLGYQGIFWHLDMPLVGVGWEFFTPKHMEFHGKLNFLKSGIVFADEVNTVSPGYRDEILTAEFGFGLEGVLQEKGPRLSGILNGVDYKTWNPESDTLIAQRYSVDDLSGKRACKEDLQRFAGLPISPNVPLVGMVSRFSTQKGVDYLADALPEFLDKGTQFCVLGTGELRFQTAYGELAAANPDKMAVFLDYNNVLAHKIFAGSDMLVVPSRYEPCGLTQLYALKYGSVPVVRSTGGLIDTVEPFASNPEAGSGFRFEAADAAHLSDALRSALELYKNDPDVWQRLMLRGMQKDFSWRRSAEEYMKLYKKAVSDRENFLTQFLGVSLEG